MPEETLEPVFSEGFDHAKVLQEAFEPVFLGGLPRDRATCLADLTINVDAWPEVDCLEVLIHRTLAAVLRSFARSLSTLGCLSEFLSLMLGRST